MFKKAEKSKSKLRLLLTGISGSGKTYSALLISKGLDSKKIALIDTENGSASLYADRFQFDVCEIKPPYTTLKYIEAIKFAEKEGYDTIIIDSVSHQWAGDGGLLNKKEQLDAQGKGNSYTNWAKITPEHEKFKSTILSSPSHIICTARSKQDYVVEMNDKGKQAPRKVGMAPIQRDGLEYEYTLVLDMDVAHQASSSKDRTSLFDGQIFIPGEQTGKILIDWLNSGKEPVIAQSPNSEALRAIVISIRAIQKELFLSDDELKASLHREFKTETMRGLTISELDRFYKILCDTKKIATEVDPDWLKEAGGPITN